MTEITKIAGWIAGLQLDGVPTEVVERARLQVENTIAAAQASRESGAVVKLERAVRALESSGPSSVVGARYRLAAPAAAYMNAAASIAHDWDDYLLMGHTGHSAVWASRAVAEQSGSSPDEATVAQIVANEVAGRIGMALVIGPHNGQFWSSIHCAGAAAAASKVLGLDAARTAQALAVALYQPPFGLWPGFMGPDSKLLTAAEPTAQGIRAAFLAAQGFTGPLEVIEDRRGLLASFAFSGLPSALGGLGETWLTQTLAFKPYPGCAYLQGPVEAFLRLQRERGFEASQVAAVKVDAGMLTAGMEGLSRGGVVTPVRVNFSVALSLAAAALAGRLTHHEMSAEWLAAQGDELQRLASLIEVEHDWDLTFETIGGLAAGVDLRKLLTDVPLHAWPSVLRRVAELDTDGAAADLRSLGQLATNRRLPGVFKAALRDGSRRRRANGPVRQPVVDGAAARLRFPVRVNVRLADGGEFSTSGRERGGMGSSLQEAREVVAGKQATVAGGAQ